MRHGFWIGGAALALLGGCSISADKNAAEAAAGQFHNFLAAARYHDIYASTSDDFRHVTTEPAFTAMLQVAHDRLGAAGQSNESDWRVNFDNGGNMVVLHYSTQFANGHGDEEFVYRVGEGGAARLAGYHLTSPLLMGTAAPTPAPSPGTDSSQPAKPGDTPTVPITSAQPDTAPAEPAPEGGK